MNKNDFKNEIRMLPLARIELNEGQLPGLPANPRQIKQDKFDKLKKNITDYPEMLEWRSLLVYPLGKGNYIIIGGNMRYRAMQELGHTEAPAVIIPKETPVEKLQAYTILDNNGFGQWDWDALANEWPEELLGDWGLDTPGFDVNPDNLDDSFNLPDSDKKPFQQISFQFADAQAEFVKSIIAYMQQLPEFESIEKYGNQNKNGNALYEIVRQWA